MRLLSKVKNSSYLFFMRPYQTYSISESISLSVGKAGLYRSELSLYLSGGNTSGIPLDKVKCDLLLYDSDIVNNAYIALMANYYAPFCGRLIELHEGKLYSGSLNYYGVEGIPDGSQPTAFVVASFYLID